MSKRYQLLSLQCAAVLFLTGGLEAQTTTGGQHDVAGFPTTGSAVAGGVFTPTGTVATAASPAVAAAITAASVSVASSLSAGSLTTPTGAPISAAAQSTVLGVLTGAVPPAQLANSLASGGAPGPAGDLAQAMVGLTSSPGTGQVAAAIGHYNALVNGSSDGFLANPPAEFMAVHAVLVQLSGAAAAGT